MARGKWFLPYRRSRLNYEDVGVMPYLVQHDIGFNGDKLFRAVKWNGPNSGTFSLVGEVHSAGDTAGYGKKAKAADTRKAHAKAVADAKQLAGKQNPRRRNPIHGSLTWEQWNSLWPQGHLWQSYSEDEAHAINRERYNGKRLVVGIKSGGRIEMYGVIPQSDYEDLKSKKNPAARLPKQWTKAQVRVNSRGQVQVKLNNPSWRSTVKSVKKRRRASAKESGYKYVDFPSRQKQSWVARGRTKRRVNRRRRY